MELIDERADVIESRDVQNVYEGINNSLKDIPTRRTIIITMVLSFLIPVIIMVLVFLKVRIYPGGSYTVLIYDMRGQFMPAIASIRYLFDSENSLFYSFFGALGNNAFLNYSSYLLDPMIMLTVFVPLEKLPDALYFITLIKIGLCGLTSCSYFLYGRKGAKYPMIALILSCCYALMSYNIMYSQCLLWLNVVALTPMILWGIEHIIEGKKGGIFAVSLILSLYYVFQNAYMVGIFCLLYFIYRFTEIRKGRVRIFGRFVILSICSVGIFMPAFLPSFLNIMSGRFQTYNTMEGQLTYYPFWASFKQLMSCQYDTIYSGGLPSVFCGSFVPIIAVALIIFSKRSNKYKIVSVCILLFYFISFCFVPLNQFWHGFVEPNCYPCRYSFTFDLFLLIMIYDNIDLLYKKATSTPQFARRLIEYGVLIFTSIELCLNAGYILSSNNLSMGYTNSMEYETNIRYVKDALDHIDDSDFYRIGRDIPFTTNDGMLFGYNGIGYFSSMFERNTMNLLGMLGYSQNEHMLRDYGGNPIADSLLGVRYKLIKEPYFFGMYDSIYKNGMYEVEYNEAALPLGFLIKNNKLNDEDIKDLLDGINAQNSFALQEYVLSDMYGERVHVYEEFEYDIEDNISDEFARSTTIHFIAKDNRPVWMYCVESDQYDWAGETKWKSSDDIKKRDIYAKLFVNGEERYAFMDNLSTMCTCLGQFEAGEGVTIEASSTIPYKNPWLVYYSEDVGKDTLMNIKEKCFKVSKHKDGKILGSINVEDSEAAMVLSLPYMQGYKIKVDGKKTDYNSYRNSLLAVKLSKGEHVIEISYLPPGFISGLIVGIISLLIILIINIMPEKQNNNDT